MGWWERPDRREHTVCYDERSAPPDRLVNKYSTFPRFSAGRSVSFFVFSPFPSCRCSSPPRSPAPGRPRTTTAHRNARAKHAAAADVARYLFCFYFVVLFFFLSTLPDAHTTAERLSPFCECRSCVCAAVPIVCARNNVQISWPFFSRSDERPCSVLVVRPPGDTIRDARR